MEVHVELLVLLSTCRWHEHDILNISKCTNTAVVIFSLNFSHVSTLWEILSTKLQVEAKGSLSVSRQNEICGVSFHPVAGGLCNPVTNTRMSSSVTPVDWFPSYIWGLEAGGPLRESFVFSLFIHDHSQIPNVDEQLACINSYTTSPQAFANVTAASEAGFCPAWEFTVTAAWFTYLHISFRSFVNAVAKRKSTLNTKDSIAGCFYFCITAVITACWFTRLTVNWIGCSSARFVSILSWSWSCYLRTVLFKCTMSSIS